MPSPTSSTRPTSLAASCVRYWLISDCNTETISSALNLMAASRDDLVANGFQPLPDRRIIDPIAHADDHAAQEIGIEPGFEQWLLVKTLPELVQQALALIVGQRHDRADLHSHPPGTLIPQIAVGGEDRPNQIQPLVIVQDQQEIHEQLAGPAPEERLNHSRLVTAADGAA